MFDIIVQSLVKIVNNKESTVLMSKLFSKVVTGHTLSHMQIAGRMVFIPVI